MLSYLKAVAFPSQVHRVALQSLQVFPLPTSFRRLRVFAGALWNQGDFVSPHSSFSPQHLSALPQDSPFILNHAVSPHSPSHEVLSLSLHLSIYLSIYLSNCLSLYKEKALSNINLWKPYGNITLAFPRNYYSFSIISFTHSFIHLLIQNSFNKYLLSISHTVLGPGICNYRTENAPIFIELTF